VVTSALESNIGLKCIAQFTFIQNSILLPQGLGTGGLYTNNLNRLWKFQWKIAFLNKNWNFNLEY
jgi:hypothetical protein